MLLAGIVAATPVRAAGEADSLFDAGSYQSLVAEVKAMHAGDVLTVIVQETSTASSTADLHADRGLTFGLTGTTKKVESRFLSANLNADTGSDGTGSTQRSGHLLAQLSVHVLLVRPNGDMVIEGQQSLRINDEEQLITLSGVVRGRDIADNNTVLSSRIADARIRFDGEGFVTDQSKPSWIARVLNFLGL